MGVSRPSRGICAAVPRRTRDPTIGEELERLGLASGRVGTSPASAMCKVGTLSRALPPTVIHR